jgi:hypothetical protein
MLNLLRADWLQPSAFAHHGIHEFAESGDICVFEGPYAADSP